MTSRTINSGTPASFAYQGNEMSSASGSENFTLSYDKNGNLIAALKDANTSVSLAYNWENKLRSAVVGANSIALKYDPAGNRVYKASTVNGNRKYIVDISGSLPVILLEIDPVDKSIRKAYIYANSQILAQYNGADKYYYLHDRLGSVRQMINENGAVIALYTYNPFGETIEEQGSVDNPFMFTGQYYDKETGQYYLRNRQYIPYIARLSSRDLLMPDFNEPLTLHRYLYCQNDPINWIDPSGLDKYIGIDWGQGNTNGHMYVAVDVWSKEGKKIGQMRYEFMPRTEWYYSLLSIIAVGPGNTSSEDYVYDDKNLVLKWKQNREADERMKTLLDYQLENPPSYSLHDFSCWRWSILMFGMGYDDTLQSKVWDFILTGLSLGYGEPWE